MFESVLTASEPERLVRIEPVAVGIGASLRPAMRAGRADRLPR